MEPTEAALEELLSRPSARLVADLSAFDGDLMILGVGGKMGPSLAELAVRALHAAGRPATVYGVARFSQRALRDQLEAKGVRTIAADLLDEAALGRLPQVDSVIFMAGTKFGTQRHESYTWAMNSYLPGRVAAHFANARMVAFSTGNLYPLVPVGSGGATEQTDPEPIGEYPQSCLGRERILQHFSEVNGTRMAFLRLNYAIDMRYGVLHEIAKSVFLGREVDVTMGALNCIWQGDANEVALRALNLVQTPPLVLNLTGPETISIRWAAEEFGRRFGKEPKFSGAEQSTAFISNATKAHGMLGYPQVALQNMMDWTAEWVAAGAPDWEKPTHFEERRGRY